MEGDLKVTADGSLTQRAEMQTLAFCWQSGIELQTSQVGGHNPAGLTRRRRGSVSSGTLKDI